jgi:hypothetical protein
MYRCTDVFFDCFLFALTDSQIGDEGVRALAEALKTNKTVTSIYLGRKKCVCFCSIDIAHAGNQIGFEGATALAETLKTNKTLTLIDLWRKDLCFV